MQVLCHVLPLQYGVGVFAARMGDVCICLCMVCVRSSARGGHQPVAQATFGFSMKGGFQWPGVVLRGCMVTVLCSKHVVCSQGDCCCEQLGVKLSGPPDPLHAGLPCSSVAAPWSFQG